jgi:hypothetical protein
MHGIWSISNRKFSNSAILSNKYLFTIAVFLKLFVYSEFDMCGGDRCEALWILNERC